jgi:hypothetical protein
LRSLRRERAESSARSRLAVERIELCDQSSAALTELRDRDAMLLLAERLADQRAAVRPRVIEV